MKAVVAYYILKYIVLLIGGHLNMQLVHRLKLKIGLKGRFHSKYPPNRRR